MATHFSPSVSKVFIPQKPNITYLWLFFMGNRAEVIESIQKLLALGVPDKEIAENLFDVGINQKEAYSLIREARDSVSSSAGVSGSAKETVSPEGKSSADSSLQVSMNDEIVSQIPLKGKSEVSGSADSAAEKKPVDVKQSVPEKEGNIEEAIIKDEDDVDDAAIEALAEEGVVVSDDDSLVVKNSVVQKTPEGKEDSKNKGFSGFDGSVEVPSRVNSFSNKSDSSSAGGQKSDFASVQKPVSSKEKFLGGGSDFEELWKKGIVVAVNAKLSEMKKLKEGVDSEIQQKVDEALRKELYQFKVLMDSQKDLIVQSSKDALDAKQKEINFIIDAKIAELKQYNKSLGGILDSIESSKKEQADALAQIKSALEDSKRTKTQLVVEMNSELIKSKSGAQAFLDSASLQLSQMDEKINKALELEKNIAEGLLAEAEQRIEQLTIARADELIGELMAELNKIQSSSRKFSPEVIDQKILVLEEFKKQFLLSMEDALNQINSAIDELNQKSLDADRVLEEKTLAIEAKLDELTRFEKELTSRIERSLNTKPPASSNVSSNQDPVSAQSSSAASNVSSNQNQVSAPVSSSTSSQSSSVVPPQGSSGVVSSQGGASVQDISQSSSTK